MWWKFCVGENKYQKLTLLSFARVGQSLHRAGGYLRLVDLLEIESHKLYSNICIGGGGAELCAPPELIQSTHKSGEDNWNINTVWNKSALGKELKGRAYNMFPNSVRVLSLAPAAAAREYIAREHTHSHGLTRREQNRGVGLLFQFSSAQIVSGVLEFTPRRWKICVARADCIAISPVMFNLVTWPNRLQIGF